MPVTLRYVVCDVFTDTPLTGNQLAVFTDARALDEAAMQALALEVGFSECVFVLPAEGDGNVRIRIFTPVTELPFAGHPVLGTAFVLGAPLQLPAIRLETGAGVVAVELDRDESGRIVFGRMEQPVPRVEPFADVELLFRALGVESAVLPVERYDNGATHILVALGSEEEVAALQPDVAALAPFAVTGVDCFAGSGTRLEEPHVLAARRGRRHRLGRRPDRLPSRPPRGDRLGRRHRDPAGSRDRPALDAVRQGGRRRGPDRPRHGRWPGRHRRPRRVPAAVVGRGGPRS